MKITVTGQDARDRILKGATFLADAVRATLGPYGMNAALEKGNTVTNDGVTIAREIEHQDVIAQRGLTLLREACIKTVQIVGDGTTSSIVLAHAILVEAMRLLPKEGVVRGNRRSPTDIKKMIEKEMIEVIDKLKEMSTPITTEAELIASARVSSEDETLATLIGKTQFELGPDGVILVEETNAPESSIERINGIRTDNGLAIPSMFTNAEKQRVEFLEGCKVIITNHVLMDFEEIHKVLLAIHAQKVRHVVIIARAFGADAIRLVYENLKNNYEIIPVNAPYEDQAEILKDMAAVLGGRFFDVEATNLDDMMVSDVGWATSFIGRRDDCVFANTDPDERVKARIDKRVAELQERLKATPSDFERRGLEKRISQLTKGFGLLRVGDKSDVARKYKKDKADDAVNAVRAAYQEGVVPGAGLALKRISDDLPEDHILKRPICSIYEQIISTAETDFEIPEWVRDPLKVQRVVVEKACSVAATLATIHTVVATEKDKPRYVEEVKAPSETVN